MVPLEVAREVLEGLGVSAGRFPFGGVDIDPEPPQRSQTRRFEGVARETPGALDTVDTCEDVDPAPACFTSPYHETYRIADCFADTTGELHEPIPRKVTLRGYHRRAPTAHVSLRGYYRRLAFW